MQSLPSKAAFETDPGGTVGGWLDDLEDIGTRFVELWGRAAVGCLAPVARTQTRGRKIGVEIAVGNRKVLGLDVTIGEVKKFFFVNRNTPPMCAIYWAVRNILPKPPMPLRRPQAKVDRPSRAPLAAGRANCVAELVTPLAATGTSLLMSPADDITDECITVVNAALVKATGLLNGEVSKHPQVIVTHAASLCARQAHSGFIRRGKTVRRDRVVDAEAQVDGVVQIPTRRQVGIQGRAALSGKKLKAKASVVSTAMK